MTGLSESVEECCSAPWLLRTKDVEALAPPARIGHTTWKSFSRSWRWCDSRLIYATIGREVSKMKYFRASRSGTCVSNLGPTSPTPVHSRTQRSKHRWSSNLLTTCTIVWGGRWDSFSRRGGSAKKNAGFGSSLCLNRTYGQPDKRTSGQPYLSFWSSEISNWNALSLRARAGPLRIFRALLYYCNPELRVLSSA